MTRAIEPGATLGVLGAGQLGRMFAIAARRMGYRVHVLSPDDDTPAGQVADVEIRAAYDDLDAVARFAQNVDVVTFEFENVSAAAAETAERFAPVRPAGRVLHTTQNRLREKTALSTAGIPVTRFAAVHTAAELNAAVESLGLPAVLKTSDWGYDGKGQRLLRTPADVAEAGGSLNGREHVLEAFVDFECEVSVVIARGLDGAAVAYGPLHNEHRHHILDVTTYPAPVDPRIAAESIEMARAVCQTLDVVGVLCVEFFVARDGRLLVNELAPRPHNSGHLTIDACVTCQFAQQVRTICGLPLGSPRWHSPAAMVNLLGDEWRTGTPNWSRTLAQEGVQLHLYGKSEPRPGRKMGHLTALGATPEEARRRALAARELLRPDAAAR
ncbi:MAG: 5-(carboxyamino)imidazole ribonucleotide synthase [Pirellulales bacterium]